MSIRIITLIVVGLIALAFVGVAIFKLVQDGAGQPVIEESSGLVSRSDLPRLAIITGEQLEFFLSARQRAGEQNNEWVLSGGNSSEEQAEEEIVEGLEVLLRATNNQLEAQLGRYLTKTDRFQVVEPLQVRQIIANLTSRSANDEAQTRQKRERVTRTLLENFRNMWHGSPDEDMTQRTFTRRSDERGQAGNVSVDLARADLREAAEQLGADLILIVRISQPRAYFQRQRSAYSNEMRAFIGLEPVFSYSLFEVKEESNTLIISNATRPERPIRIPVRDRNSSNSSLGSQIAQDTGNLSLFQVIAATVTRDVIDALAPAQIYSIDPLTIDRGRLDGVQVGDTYIVERPVKTPGSQEGLKIRERIRQPVGTAVVERVQDNISYVRFIPDPGSVAEAEIGDLVAPVRSVRQRESSTPGARDRSTDRGTTEKQRSSRPPALGARQINDRSAAKEGQTRAELPALAVGEIRIDFADCGPTEKKKMQCPFFEERENIIAAMMLTNLQNDNRIRLLSRQDFRAMNRERDFKDAGQNRFRLEEEGRIVADYLLTGDLNFLVRTRSHTRRVGGVSKTTIIGYDLVGEGDFRIVDPETTDIIEASSVSDTVRYGSQDVAKSERAYRELGRQISEELTATLLIKLFPIVLLEKGEGDLITLGGGAQVGLQIGDRLTVFDTRSAATDFYTERRLSRVRRKVGEVIVVDVQRDISFARYAADPFEVKRGFEAEPVGRLRGASKATQAPTISPSKKGTDPDVPF